MRAILRLWARATSDNRQTGASVVRKFLRRRAALFRDVARPARGAILGGTSALCPATARSRHNRAAHKRRAEKMARRTKNR
jgi:hypothetical protein